MEEIKKDVEKVKRYIELIEGGTETFDEILERIEKWKKEKPSNK